MSTSMALAGGNNRGDAVSGSSSVQLQTSGAHDTSLATRRGLLGSPRRAVVALDSQPKATTTPTTVYDKQLLWKQHGQKKVEHKTLELLSQEDAECTFNPKINKTPQSLANQPQLPRKARVPASVMQAALPLSPTASEFLMSDGVSYSDCSSQYTDSPRTMRSVELETGDALRDGGNGYMDGEEEELVAAPMFPTESHESSILLHLARQERAREEAQKAQQKLVSRQPAKDFTKVTTARPFGLSVTNRKPRSTSASPTDRPVRSLSQPKGRSTLSGSKQSTKRRTHGTAPATEDASGDHATSETVAEETNHAITAAVESQALLWQKERASLLSIIETQRHELEQRERSQEDAARLADSFSAAMQTFAQRLEVVERTTAAELSEMKQLLAKQTAATDLLLHALGLSSTAGSSSVSSSSSKGGSGGLTLSPSSPPSSPPPPSSASTAGLRRETK